MKRWLLLHGDPVDRWVRVEAVEQVVVAVEAGVVNVVLTSGQIVTTYEGAPGEATEAAAENLLAKLEEA